MAEPLITYRGLVNTWECDQMGHQNVQFYVDKHAQAMAHLAALIGLTPAAQLENKMRLTARRERIRFRREMHAGALATIGSRVVEVGGAGLRVVSDLLNGDNDMPAASFDAMLQLQTVGDGDWRPLDGDSERRARGLLDGADAPPAGFADYLPDRQPDGMFETYRGSVNTWECGLFGLMAPRFYTARFSDAAGHVYKHVGIESAFMRQQRWGTAALDYKTTYFAPLRAGDVITVRTGFLDVGNKTITFYHRLVDESTGQLAATIEIVSVLFDLEARKSFPVPDDIRARVEARRIRKA